MIEFDVVDRPIDRPAEVAAVLPEVLVPACWWRGVAMRRAEPVSMTPLERFTLELALTTGRADTGEFIEITGLPGTLLPIAARRLVTSGALITADEEFLPRLPAAQHAAQSQMVYEQRHTSLDVILLPHTGDLLLLDPKKSGLRALERLRPRSVGNAPVTGQLAKTTLADYLRARLQDGTVAGAGDDITDVGQLAVESPPLAPDGRCPVYQCQGRLHIDGDWYFPTIILPGGKNKDPVSVALPGADGLVKRWLALAEALSDPTAWTRAWMSIVDWGAHAAPRVERTGPVQWACKLSADDARRLADRGRNLALPIGVAIRDEDAVLEATIELTGADRTAEEMIDTDRALTAAARPGADTSAVPSTRSAWERAWQLGFPGLVYALREAEDFDYA